MNIYPNDILDETDSAHITQAEAYVRTRFYPPLPTAYGELAVAAVKLVNSGDADNDLVLPDDLNPLPRGADQTGTVIKVKPAELVSVLRLQHMIDVEEELV